MTTKKPWCVRSVVITLLLMIPLVIGYGSAEEFHFGEWMMAFGLTGLFGLLLSLLIDDRLPVIGDKDVG